MKIFYKIIIYLSIIYLFFLYTITFGIPNEYFVAFKLSNNPDKWNIVVDEDFQEAFHDNEIKESLLTFMKNNKHSYLPNKMYTIIGIIIFFFGILGFYRENKIIKYSKKNKGDR